MAQKDLSEKQLISFNDVFADICNGLIFKKPGKIKPSELFPFPTEMLGCYREYLKQGYRDVVKLYKHCGINMMLIGVENQSKVDYSMVSRMMLYDAMNYAMQDETRRHSKRKHRKRKRTRRKVERLPVVSCVLYFGYKQRWTGPRTLHEWLNLPTDLANLVNDYKIHVIEVAWLTDEERAQLTGDIRILADALHDLRTTGMIQGSKRVVKHARELLMALRAITNTPQFADINLIGNSTGDIKMCDIMDKYNQKLRDEGYQAGLEQGRDQGLEQGRKEGIDQGINLIAQRLINEMGDNMDMVARITGLSPETLNNMRQTQSQL